VCELENESIEHYLLVCSDYDGPQTEMLQKIGHLNQSITDDFLIRGTEHLFDADNMIINACIIFINETARFSR
jgi:hypothetical protein